MSKKILIHTIAFSPDANSTAYLYNDLALRFVEEGYEVVVITTSPHNNVLKNEVEKQALRKHLFGLYYESNYHGIRVKHVYQKKFRSTFLRLAGFVLWHIVSFFIALFEKDIDIILSPSPPLTIGYVNVIIGKVKKSKVVYNVQEIYPDLLINESDLKSQLIINVLSKIERTVYNRSDAVTTIDQIFYNTIVNRFKDKGKLHIIPNFVDTAIYHPLEQRSVKLDHKLFPDTENLKLMYAGNVGLAQDWETFIRLAEAVRDEAIEFFVIGNGAKMSYVAEMIHVKKLEKVHLISYQQRELMNAILTYSDLQFVFMSPSMDMHGFPSKVYSIMACGKPLLVCSGESTPIVNFLKDKHCAHLITEKDSEKKLDELIHFLKTTNKTALSAMGANGVKTIEEEYSRDIVTKKYVDLCDKLINR